MSSDAAKHRPVELALSGPSGGVVGAATIAEKKGVPDVLTLDMGGTSTDVSLVEDGKPETTRQTKVGYREFKSRAVDVNTVGAGGGSIARVQLSGSLQVGPESAGADPGPACYGQGGEEPTVTDANVVLGRIPSNVQLGGSMELDRDAARDAIQTVADERDSTLEEAAQAILDIVNENMYGALRVVSVERGYDPRDFGLVAFGGAGPMHANALADVMDAYPLIVPPGPGVMSAFGFLTSDVQNEFSETYLKTDRDVDGEEVYDAYRDLQAEATEWLVSEGVDEANHAFEYYADCRYYRQDVQMSIPIDLENLRTDEGIAEIKDDFEARHDQRFGFSLDAPSRSRTSGSSARGRYRASRWRRASSAARTRARPRSARRRSSSTTATTRRRSTIGHCCDPATPSPVRRSSPTTTRRSSSSPITRRRSIGTPTSR